MKSGVRDPVHAQHVVERVSRDLLGIRRIEPPCIREGVEEGTIRLEDGAQSTIAGDVELERPLGAVQRHVEDSCRVVASGCPLREFLELPLFRLEADDPQVGPGCLPVALETASCTDVDEQQRVGLVALREARREEDVHQVRLLYGQIRGRAARPTPRTAPARQSASGSARECGQRPGHVRRRRRCEGARAGRGNRRRRARRKSSRPPRGCRCCRRA